jgi:pyridoxal phosphate-dependent aminotransferase EpsN
MNGDWTPRPEDDRRSEGFVAPPSALRTRARGRVYLSPPHMSGRERAFVEEAFSSNFIAPAGPMLDAFEREFAESVGVPHAAAVSSGTAALHLVLRLLGVGPGDEVWLPSLTFVGGVAPICQLGAEPVFLDVSAAHWTLDVDLLEVQLAAAARRNRLPKAVVAVDLYGQSCDAGAVEAACAAHDVPMVTDSAEALGATYHGRPVGGRGRAAIFSFNGNKILTTSGGGMVVSHDAALVEGARFLSQQARDPAPHYEHSTLGYNYRMSSLCAAVGRGQLPALAARVAARRAVFRRYRAALAALPGISFMPEAAWGRCTRWLSVIRIDPERFGADREAVRIALEAENIEARPVWKPMHLQPVFAGARRHGGAVSEALFASGLCLPSGSALSPADQARVVATITALAAAGRNRSRGSSARDEASAL